MTTAIILVAIALIFIGFVLVSVRGTTTAKGTLDDIGTATGPVDLRAFQNLTDPKEDEFLRSRLPAREFRRVQRLRLRAAVEYVQRTANNAAVLLRIAESMRQQDPAVAEISREIVNAALRLRMNAMLVLAVLYFRICFPSVTAPVERIAERYDDLRGQFARLARVQRPAEAGHLLASL